MLTSARETQNWPISETSPFQPTLAFRSAALVMCRSPSPGKSLSAHLPDSSALSTPRVAGKRVLGTGEPSPRLSTRSSPALRAMGLRSG